jgi:iron complex outermembrane receptor protein
MLDGDGMAVTLAASNSEARRTRVKFVGILHAGMVLLAGAAQGQERRFELDTMQVSVGSRAQPGLARMIRSIEVLDRQQLARLPVHTLQEALAWMIGVDVLSRSPAQADVAIRGSSFEQVVVLVDGVLVSDDQTGHFDLDVAIPLESVERIEILRGSGSSVYGPDAIGGVINIVTSRGASASRARVEAGTFSTVLAEVDGGVSWMGSTFSAGASHAQSDGHRSGTDYRNWIARASGDVALAAGAMELDVGVARRDFGAADFYAPYNSYEETGTTQASVRWQPARANTRFSIEPRLSFRRHTDHFVLVRDNPSVYENHHTNWRLGAELTARYALRPLLQLVTGATADWMDLESTRLGDIREERGSVFGEIAAGNAQGFALISGLRWDWHSSYGSFLSPSLAAGWRAAPWLQLRASTDRGLRAPTWTERFYEDPANLGNPDLEAEEFWSAEFGFSVAPAARTTIDVSAFVRRATNLIDWVKPADSLATSPWQITNIERATFRGFELTASTRLSGVTARLRATALSFTDDDGAGLVSKYALRPVTQAISAEAIVPLPAGLSLAARLGQSRRAGEAAYALADAMLSWRYRNLTMYVDGTNLTDSDYLDVSAKRAMGRAFHVGIRLGPAAEGAAGR